MDRERILEKSPAEIREMAIRGDVIVATKRGAERLEEVIQAKKAEITEQEMALGEAARDNPDLPENTEFKEIKTRLQFELPRSLNELRNRQANTIVFEEYEPGVIGIGTEFEAEMQYPDGEFEHERFILLGPIEAMYMKDEFAEHYVVSYQTPLGQTLWGQPLKNGASYLIETPGGTTKCVIKNKDE